MPPVFHDSAIGSTETNQFRYPRRRPCLVKPRIQRSTFTPPHHAVHAAQCGLFLLRRSQGRRPTWSAPRVRLRGVLFGTGSSQEQEEAYYNTTRGHYIMQPSTSRGHLR